MGVPGGQCQIRDLNGGWEGQWTRAHRANWLFSGPSEAPRREHGERRHVGREGAFGNGSGTRRLTVDSVGYSRAGSKMANLANLANLANFSGTRRGCQPPWCPSVEVSSQNRGHKVLVRYARCQDLYRDTLRRGCPLGSDAVARSSPWLLGGSRHRSEFRLADERLGSGKAKPRALGKTGSSITRDYSRAVK